jgi:hypothetical protein
MLRTCTGGEGNLLLNIGPLPDGSVPPEATERLGAVGNCLQKSGKALYGNVDRAADLRSPQGEWTRKGNTVYFWCFRWPGRELVLSGIDTRLRSVRIFPDGPPLRFEQTFQRLRILDLPETCPDTEVGVVLLEMKFHAPPRQYYSYTRVTPPFEPADLTGKGVKGPVHQWRRSPLQSKPSTGIATAPWIEKEKRDKWTEVHPDHNGFVSTNDPSYSEDAVCYFEHRLTTREEGFHTLHLGHDGGIKVFLDGKDILIEPELFNPAIPGRSSIQIMLPPGTHDLLVALDTCHGLGWGICLHVEGPGQPLP